MSILQHAKTLEGQTFHNVLDRYNHWAALQTDNSLRYNFNHRSKGGLGNLIERCHFGYVPNSDQHADFREVSIELKLTPIDIKKEKLKAGERLSITNLSLTEEVTDNFEESHVWEKIHRILLIHYLREKGLDRLDYSIQHANLFTPPPEDLKIIRDDYHKIVQMVQEGRAHELSEGMTLYLGACTKGATAESSWRPQFYGEHIKAKKRNFCFKISYMDHILQEYVLKEKVPYDSILSSAETEKTLEEVTLDRLRPYFGKTSAELSRLVGFTSKDKKAAKQYLQQLALRLLGVRSNRAEEFVKAGIVVKAMRIEQNGSVKEQISLPAMSFNEVASSEWEESELYNYFSSTRFFFVIYRSNGQGDYVLESALFWNMPEQDLEGEVHKVWERTKAILNEGVKLERSKNGMKNNLPKIKESHMMHVRPHAQRGFYILEDGTPFGRGKLSDADQLPDGRYMTKQCFWLHNDYLLQELGLK